jgi:hypothetical protein
MKAFRGFLPVLCCAALAGCTGLNNQFGSRATTRGTPVTVPPAPVPPPPSTVGEPLAAGTSFAPAAVPNAPERLYNLPPAEKKTAGRTGAKKEVTHKKVMHEEAAESSSEKAGQNERVASEKQSQSAQNTSEEGAETETVLPVRKTGRKNTAAKPQPGDESSKNNSPQSFLRNGRKVSQPDKLPSEILPVSNPSAKEPLGWRFES